MTQTIKPQLLKGFRDFLPAQKVLRQKVIRTIQHSFELFGFEPLETPVLEYASLLEGKYGEEGEKLIYKFTDRGGREVALQYDLTIPLSRVMAMYPALPKPFKCYQLSPVWRADKPQRGRFREFWQCDADIIGSESALADAEIIATIHHILKALVGSAICLQLGFSLGQWANEDVWPSKINWFLIWVGALGQGFNAIVSFTSSTVSKWIAARNGVDNGSNKSEVPSP